MAACVGCGNGDDEVSGASGQRTALTIEVRMSPDAAPQRYELRCDPPGGTHPDSSAACTLLQRVDASAFEPVPPDRACTQIYGGPQTARVTGVLRGERIDAGFSRTNGCEIERWDRLRPLLPSAES